MASGRISGLPLVRRFYSGSLPSSCVLLIAGPMSGGGGGGGRTAGGQNPRDSGASENSLLPAYRSVFFMQSNLKVLHVIDLSEVVCLL